MRCVDILSDEIKRGTHICISYHNQRVFVSLNEWEQAIERKKGASWLGKN